MKSRVISGASALVGALAVTIVLALSAAPEPQLAHADNLARQSEEVADIVELALPSVVNISTTRLVNTRTTPMGSFGNRGESRVGKSLGSGVVISGKGYVLTNNHVVANAQDILVGFSDGREHKAKIVGADPDSDLAVLKLEGKKALKNLVPIKLGRSGKMRLGETVLAIGNPFGVGQTVTMGIVSAKGRANMGILDYEDFIQTDAAINPGNSGGALINMRGELIGINTAILSRTGGSQGIGFAIPTDIARPIMKALIKDGRVSRGYLGVSIQTLTDDLSEELRLKVDRGVLISQVVKGSPAHKAGLKRNDVVLSLNGSRTKTAAQFRTKIASLGAKSKVAFKIARGSKKLAAKITLGKYPKRDRTRVAKAKKSSFGVSLSKVSRDLKRRYDLPSDLRRGVVVTRVTNGSRADDIGLKPGDVLLEVNRQDISTPKQFQSAFAKSKDRVALLVYRDGRQAYVIISK